jgi:hypothetical protein
MLCVRQSLPGDGSQQCPLLPRSHSYRLATVSQLIHCSNCQFSTGCQVRSVYDWRSVSRSVLVSSPIWGSWPDINYIEKVTVLSTAGALSDERSGLSFKMAVTNCPACNISARAAQKTLPLLQFSIVAVQRHACVRNRHSVAAVV